MMNKRVWMLTGWLIAGLFVFQGQARAATQLIFDDHGNIIGSYPGGAKIPGTNIRLPDSPDIERTHTADVPVPTRNGDVTVPTKLKQRIPQKNIKDSAMGCIGKGWLGAATCAATAAQILDELLDQPTGAGRYRQCPDGTYGFICKETGMSGTPVVLIGSPSPGSTGGSWGYWGYTGYSLDTITAECKRAWSNPDLQAEGAPSYTVTTWSTINGRAMKEASSWCGKWNGSTWQRVTSKTSVREDYRCEDWSARNQMAAWGSQCGTGVKIEVASDEEVGQSLQEKMDAEYEANRRLADALYKDMEDAGMRGDSVPDFQNPGKDVPTEMDAPPISTPEKTKSETTTQKPDGSTDTTTTKEKSTVTPEKSGTVPKDTQITFNITNVTTETTTNSFTNQTTTRTTKAPEGEQSKEDLSFIDPAMPDVPKLYTQKYPDGIAGVWRDSKPDITSTQFWQGIRSMFPTFGSNGQCPSWSMSFNLGAAGNYGTIPFDVPCWIYQAIGLIILTTAAFTARKIIF